MNGQWIGLYGGTNTGRLIVELDDIGRHYEGYAYAHDDIPSLPSFRATLGFVPKGQIHFKSKISLDPIDIQSGSILSGEEAKRRYPEVTIPRSAETEWHVDNDGLQIKFSTDVDTYGQGIVTKSSGDRPSDLVPLKIDSWDDFRYYATNRTPYCTMFRGQADNTWRLRTSFYRTGRAALPKFLTEDINALHRHLSGLTDHRFNLGDPLDYASFLDLVRHHGYPTPTIDWTFSPFIAAYFAYRNLRTKDIKEDQKVRILVFEHKLWSSSGVTRSLFVNPGFLHITPLEPLAINNPRAIPQQSVSLVTNIDDIETFIIEAGREKNATYLHAIDLPAIERKQVMRELSLMGVNGGTLFPGLDGACEQLKERFFDL
jgi:hypothetical protein